MALAIKGFSAFDAATRGLRGLAGVARSVLGGVQSSQVGVSPEYQNLIETQMKLNQEMMNVSLFTNIERSKHDARMSVVRNVRVQ